MEKEIIYIRASQVSHDKLVEGVADGRLKFWRVDNKGERWFKGHSLPTIHGVPERAEVDCND